MTEEQIKQAKMYGQLLKTFHPLVLQQIELLSLAVFKDARRVTIEFAGKLLCIKLEAYPGLKGWINRLRYKSKHSQWAAYLVKMTDFWLFTDYDGKKPQIQIEWLS
jgi:hypothetical protein